MDRAVVKLGGHGSVSLSGLDLPPSGGVISMATRERTLLFPHLAVQALSVFVCPATTLSGRFLLISGDLRQDQRGLLRGSLPDCFSHWQCLRLRGLHQQRRSVPPGHTTLIYAFKGRPSGSEAPSLVGSRLHMPQRCRGCTTSESIKFLQQIPRTENSQCQQPY